MYTLVYTCLVYIRLVSICTVEASIYHYKQIFILQTSPLNQHNASALNNFREDTYLHTLQSHFSITFIKYFFNFTNIYRNKP